MSGNEAKVLLDLNAPTFQSDFFDLDADRSQSFSKSANFPAKRFRAWDDRGLKGRLGLCGAAVGLALFGSQGAGIAALGTAIGVPLWVVFGAGAAFLGVLYEEITGKKPNPKTTYRVIDAEQEDKG